MMSTRRPMIDGVVRPAARASKHAVPHELVRTFVTSLLEDEVHAKRVDSIANAVTGITQATVVTIQLIGQGLAAALGTNARHAIEQVDRLLINARLDVWELFALWVPFVLADRPEALVAIDWTDFDADDHVTCALHLITNHGSSTALVWKTIPKSSLRGRRSQVETVLIERLHAIVPSTVRVTLLADRAFGDLARYQHLAILGWDFAIRFRDGILVEHAGMQQPAAAWLPTTGRAVLLRGAKVTGDEGQVGAVVCVRKPRMKEAWCLATSLRDATGPEVVKLYARRFTIEETFRDQKDLRFGLGLKATHIRDCVRRDRLLFLSSLAHAFLTLLGAASEAIGYDRRLKANTVKTRPHSLFRQGALWFALLPNQPVEGAAAGGVRAPGDASREVQAASGRAVEMRELIRPTATRLLLDENLLRGITFCVMKNRTILLPALAIAAAMSIGHMSIALADDDAPQVEKLPAGKSVMFAAELGTTNDILGQGFDEALNATDSAGETHRVYPNKVASVDAEQYEAKFEVIDNSFALAAHGKYLFAEAGVKTSREKRFMVIRVSRISRVEKLITEGKPLANAPLFASKIYYGWAMYIVVQGEKEAFTSEIAADLKKVGAKLSVELEKKHLTSFVHLIGLKPKADGDIVLATDPSSVRDLFDSKGAAQPIYVEYTLAKDAAVESIPWAKNTFKEGQYKLDVTVSVAETNSNGQSWDAGSPPDPIVTLILDGRPVFDCKDQDKYESRCMSGRTITISKDTRLALRVVDKDVMKDDPIGETAPIIIMQNGMPGSPISLEPRGQLKAVTIMLTPSVR